jgi:hypothetical protein
MVPNDPRGLPGGERSERPQFGDDGLVGTSASFRLKLAVSPIARRLRWSSRKLNESHCLPAASAIKIG